MEQGHRIDRGMQRDVYAYADVPTPEDRQEVPTPTEIEQGQTSDR